MTRLRYIDRDGRLVDDSVALDGRGVIRDGYGVRVPMEVMDAERRRVAGDARRRKVVARDPMGRVASTYEEEEEDAVNDAARFGLTDAYGLHKPGYRYATDAAAFDAKQEA